MKWKTVRFVIRTLPVFVRECCRMGWGKLRGRAYVAPADQRSAIRGQKSAGDICYRPHPARFGAVVTLPRSQTGYIVGKGGNLVNPKRQAKKRAKRAEIRDQQSEVS